MQAQAATNEVNNQLSHSMVAGAPAGAGGGAVPPAGGPPADGAAKIVVATFAYQGQ